jgi:hypothetical protein
MLTRFRRLNRSVPGIAVCSLRVLNSSPEIAEQIEVLVDIIAPTYSDPG